MRPSLAVWLFGLAGPLAWAIHLGVIYALASVGEVTRADDGLAVRAAILLATLLAAGLQVALIVAAWRDRLPVLAREPDAEARRFWRATAGIGSLVGLVAVLWQSAPVLVVP